MEDRKALREEQEALARILHAFLRYHATAEREIKRWIRNFIKLSEEHKRLLPDYLAKCQAAEQAASANQTFLTQVAFAFNEPTLSKGVQRFLTEHIEKDRQVLAEDAEKVRYVLKNAMRDWSQEGAAERSQSYGKICGEIEKRLPASPGSRPRILVPGCGLGRLPYDLSRLGYVAEGNEYNYYMLITSSCILNCTEAAGQWMLHPFIHSNCNQLSDADQLRGVPIPDVSLRDASPSQGIMTMSAGDFEEVYSRPEYRGSYDCVATCFFLDCAHNILRFVDIIHAILREGGIWVNLGPLLYHWADAHTYLPSEELSIELSLATVEEVVRKTGFTTLQRTITPTAFNTNIRSMLQNTYRSVFWTVQKSSTQAAISPDNPPA